MGACMGTMSAEQRAALARTKAIDREMEQQHRIEQRKIKLLLLGAGESGKSTLFKQMKILYSANNHKKGFEPGERKEAIPAVFQTIIENMQKLAPHCKNNAGAELMNYQDSQPITPKVAELLKQVWSSKEVQEMWGNRGDLQVQDALEYYMKEIDRVASEGYIPTDQDILRSRVRTTGIVEEEFQIDDTRFAMFDVGGQRNERKKWIHAFEDVTCVLFVAAISEYNQVLYEDNTVNRQTEAIELFAKVCGEPWFQNTSIILFLNKEDLFREKLPRVPFRVADGPQSRNVDFKGPHCEPGAPSAIVGTPEFEACVRSATDYLIDLYTRQNQSKTRRVYPHVTCATDTTHTGVIMGRCKEILLETNLRNNGFVSI